jgi:hypothetical protein
MLHIKKVMGSNISSENQESSLTLFVRVLSLSKICVLVTQKTGAEYFMHLKKKCSYFTRGSVSKLAISGIPLSN